VDERQYKLVKS